VQEHSGPYALNPTPYTLYLFMESKLLELEKPPKVSKPYTLYTKPPGFHGVQTP